MTTTIPDNAKRELDSYSGRFYDDSPLAEFLAHGVATTADGEYSRGGGVLNIGAPLSSYLAYTDSNGWLRWNGQLWESVKDPRVIDDIRRTCKTLFASVVADPNLKPEDAKRATVLLDQRKASRLLFFLRGILTVDASEFDAQPDHLNARNGIVDLRDGMVSPHDPSFRFTKMTAVDYVPGKKSEDWISALQAVPEDVQDWLQVRYGQAATGHMTSDDTLVIQQGGGSNGKSTLEDAISGALGTFSAAIPEKALTGNGADHPTDMMTLKGARLAVVEELPEGKHLPTKRLKDLVGTKRITARLMRQDFVTFDATHSLFVNSNYVPQVAETDHGTWRRLALVKFPYRFIDPSERVLSIHDRTGDPGLRERLMRPENLEAVLAWMVAGARRWYDADRTFPATPDSVKADTLAWREDADLILAYANARLEFDPACSVLSKELYEDFSTWLSDSGRQTWNDTTFSNRLSEHELTKKNGVKKQSKARTASLTGLVRRHSPQLSAPPTTQAAVWHGIGFRKDES